MAKAQSSSSRGPNQTYPEVVLVESSPDKKIPLWARLTISFFILTGAGILSLATYDTWKDYKASRATAVTTAEVKPETAAKTEVVKTPVPKADTVKAAPAQSDKPEAATTSEPAAKPAAGAWLWSWVFDLPTWALWLAGIATLGTSVVLTGFLRRVGHRAADTILDGDAAAACPPPAFSIGGLVGGDGPTGTPLVSTLDSLGYAFNAVGDFPAYNKPKNGEQRVAATYITLVGEAAAAVKSGTYQLLGTALGAYVLKLIHSTKAAVVRDGAVDAAAVDVIIRITDLLTNVDRNGQPQKAAGGTVLNHYDRFGRTTVDLDTITDVGAYLGAIVNGQRPNVASVTASFCDLCAEVLVNMVGYGAVSEDDISLAVLEGVRDARAVLTPFNGA